MFNSRGSNAQLAMARGASTSRLLTASTTGCTGSPSWPPLTSTGTGMRRGRRGEVMRRLRRGERGEEVARREVVGSGGLRRFPRRSSKRFCVLEIFFADFLVSE